MLAENLLKTIASRGIPSVALILGATACQDDPVYFAPDNDTSTDTGGGGESDTGAGDGDTGVGDTGGESDTGGGTGDGDTGVGDTGGESDTGGGTGDGDTDTSDTGDTYDSDTGGDTGGDTDTGDTEDEPLSMDDVLRRFCEVDLTGRAGETPSALHVITCMGDRANWLNYVSTVRPGDDEACLQAYLAVYDNVEGMTCETFEYYGEEYTELWINPSAEDRYNIAVQCDGADPALIPMATQYCEKYLDCEPVPTGVEDCVMEVLETIKNRPFLEDFYECASTEVTCEEGSFRLELCEHLMPV